MNTAQRIALVVAVLNPVLPAIFSPYDYLSLQRGNIPTSDGFYFVSEPHPNREMNANFLALELIVALISAGIALSFCAFRLYGQAAAPAATGRKESC